ncbi:unnamed protein product [Rhodiola kirilowii]
MPLIPLLRSRCFGDMIYGILIMLSCFPGLISSAVVTLDSIEIFTTHEWFKKEPTVYFKCGGENKTILPDIKTKHTLYTFRGEESWQPLTNFTNTKCKRCGFYEQDIIEKDDVFEEWEFCPSDFYNPDRKYVRFKEKEFNATFSCPECIPDVSDSNHKPESHSGGNTGHVLIVILVSFVVSCVSIIGAVGAFKYWQKKKREQDQARFLKLFEEGDDLEDELELDNI